MWGNVTIFKPKLIFEKEYKNYVARIYTSNGGYYAEITVNNKTYREPERAAILKDHLECILAVLRYKILAHENIEVNDSRIYTDFKFEVKK